MEVNLEFWIRLAGAVASVLNFWGFVVTSESRTKMIFALSSLFWGWQYHLLGSESGLMIMLLCAVRQSVSVYSNRMSLKERSSWAWFFCAAAVLLTGLTAQVWQYAMLGLFANLIGTWTFFMCSNKTIRQYTLITNTLWAAHAWVFESWELLACMLILNLANLYGLYKLQLQNKTPVVQPAVTGPTSQVV